MIPKDKNFNFDYLEGLNFDLQQALCRSPVYSATRNLVFYAVTVRYFPRRIVARTLVAQGSTRF